MYLYLKAKLNSKSCIFKIPSENFRKIAIAYEILWFIAIDFSQRKKILLKKKFNVWCHSFMIMWTLNKYSAGYCYFSWKEKHREESETACTCIDAMGL